MLSNLSVDQVLTKARSHAKKGEVVEAQKLYEGILQNFGARRPDDPLARAASYWGGVEPEGSQWKFCGRGARRPRQHRAAGRHLSDHGGGTKMSEAQPRDHD